MTDLKNWTEKEVERVTLHIRAVSETEAKAIVATFALPRPEPSREATIEECAKVAERYGDPDINPVTMTEARVARDIAEDIRSLSPPKE